MKKILSIILSVMVLAGCSKNDIVGETVPVEITFGNTFIDNITRSIDPSFTLQSLDKFRVWGFVDNFTGKMFDEELVWKNDGKWNYSNKQYWLPNNKFYFFALSDNYTQVTPATGDAAKYGLGTVTYTNEDGKKDLIYASATRTTYNLQQEGEYDNVKFSFNHLLSKVRFTFNSGFGNLNTYISVRDVSMEVPKVAEIDLAVNNWKDNSSWTNHSSEIATLSFGNMVASGETQENVEAEIVNYTTPVVSNYERFVIPAGKDKSYTVYFTVDVYSNDVKVYTQAFSTVIKDVELGKGMAYNFKATLGPENIGPNGKPLEPIKFSVEKITQWTPAGDQNI